MKILLVFALYLISGPVSCFEVIGYSGGSVVIVSDLNWFSTRSKYIYKLEPNKCINKIPPDLRDDCDYDQRFRLYEGLGHMLVLIRGLTPQDAGVYRIGNENWGNKDIELKIINSSCCGRSETLNVSQGETVNISCRYPDQFQNNFKSFIKLDDLSFKWILSTETVTQRGRFSTSDDRGSKVVSVRIRDVREDDGGGYFCGVWIRAWTTDSLEGYHSLFTEIQLQVTATTTTPPTTTTAATTINSDKELSSPGSSILFIIGIICVVLLLIGGLTLIFYCMLRKKRHGSTDDSSGVELKDNKQVPPVVCVYEEIKPTEDLPDSDTGVYANASTTAPPKDQDLTYSTLIPPKDQDLTYSSPVSFHKNPGSPTDASVSVRKEEPETEYSTVKHPTALE